MYLATYVFLMLNCFLQGLLLVGVAAAIFIGVVHYSSDQQQRKHLSTERPAHIRSGARCTPSGNFPLWLLQATEVSLSHDLFVCCSTMGSSALWVFFTQ